MANQAAQTAYGPMSIVAFEQSYPEEQRLVHDRLALQFLPPGVKAIAGLAKWSPIRNWMFTILDRRATGVLGGTLCRKRYIDEKLLDALSTGIQACVILGAGLDTRAYRLEALRAMQVFEVDLPENSAYKKRKLLELYGRIPSHVTLIPLDFERQPLTDLLAASGYESEQKSFFICEAVSQYLSQAGVRNLFGLAGSGTNREQVNLYLYPQGFYRWNGSLWLRHRVPDLSDGQPVVAVWTAAGGGSRFPCRVRLAGAGASR